LYNENDIISIAKRENNNKRNYLIVNKLQGKHIPVSPKKSFDMFFRLADIIKNEYLNERLLLVGFAETATAIGAALAIKLNTYYIQTTRENIENVEYLFFSETHSHASEQKLVKNDIDKVIDKIDRIIFVEDEITTGNTILNIINIIEKEYSKKITFSVISILNGMTYDSECIYNHRNIKIHYILKTQNKEYEKIAEKYNLNGKYYKANINNPINFKMLKILGYINARRITTGEKYFNACENLWNKISSEIQIPYNKNILVLGTEEFMFPAIFIAEKLEENNIVKYHATTRSPICVSFDKNYPLHSRFELVSLYDSERKTYIYNLKCYDEVFVITDSNSNLDFGVNSLINALSLLGNDNITLIRWG